MWVPQTVANGDLTVNLNMICTRGVARRNGGGGLGMQMRLTHVTSSSQVHLIPSSTTHMENAGPLQPSMGPLDKLLGALHVFGKVLGCTELPWDGCVLPGGWTTCAACVAVVVSGAEIR